MNGWLVLGAVTACGILAMLHAIATSVRNRLMVREHAAECAAIHERYLRSARESRRALQEQVTIVGEDE